MMTPGRIQVSKLSYHTFLACVALMPLFSLFWQTDFLGLKLNWALYPILLAGIFFAVITKFRGPIDFFALVFLVIFYLTLALVRGGETETIIRAFISLLPFTFFARFLEVAPHRQKYFWWLYALAFALPVYYAFLQYSGKMEFYEFDFVNGETVGRISGGYNKPMNFIAFFFPIFMCGLFLWKVRQKKIGLAIVLGVLLIIYVIGHRTSLFAFLVIFVTSFFIAPTVAFIKFYYKYFLNFFVGIVSLVLFLVLLKSVGVVDLLRGRVPMWESHSHQFFDSSIFNILFGAQKVWLADQYRHQGVILFDEVHNNSYRTIVIFGIVGFFLYCAFMRYIVLGIDRLKYPLKTKFIVYSCFTFFIFYTITNEPIYYGSVLWPIFIWIFLIPPTAKSEQLKE